ncbi:MAG: hypothetical protein R2867_26785 [Caldilineaceae bacterium]
MQLFADPSRRLVSIVAPGGMGKSHLAIAVATELVPHYADGVFFVAMAPLTDAETIVPTIAAAVGYTFQGDGRTPKCNCWTICAPENSYCYWTMPNTC